MTVTRASFKRQFRAAQALHQQGNLSEAEVAYRKLSKPGKHRETALQALFDLYLQAGRPQHAAEVLIKLIKEVPDSLTYHAHLAELMQSIGQPEIAVSYYERLLERRPELADGHFSLALQYKRMFRFKDALQAYEKALELGISNVREVYSNVGVLFADMHDAAKAREMYDKALAVDADYVPALFNLAGLCEESGERGRAIELYERILALDPQHWDSIARLAQATKTEDADDALIDRLMTAAEEPSGDPLGREGIYFALGNVLDRLSRFDEAFAAYTAGNTLGKQRMQPYDRRVTEQAFDQLIRLFDSDWIAQHRTDSTASPIFVCGMFRSGSTLVERMLAAHPEITSGGELDFLPWLIARNMAPYPQRVTELSATELRLIGDEYLSLTEQLFPKAANLTDKRPDNVLHLALVKAMWPNARIIYTRRSRLDNCLSVFFQQFGGNLSYTTDLEDTADYYDQQARLIDHWQACFGESIYTVDYEALVSSPGPILRELLDFLGLEWNERCLDFTQSGGSVKTASIWQVREGLHQASSGRWRNYEAVAPQLKSM